MTVGKRPIRKPVLCPQGLWKPCGRSHDDGYHSTHRWLSRHHDADAGGLMLSGHIYSTCGAFGVSGGGSGDTCRDDAGTSCDELGLLYTDRRLPPGIPGLHSALKSPRPENRQNSYLETLPFT